MNTSQLIKDAKSRFKHLESKLYLEEKYNSLLNFTSQGGNWTATIELISYLKNNPTSNILIDNFKSPIKVDTQELVKTMETLYHKVMEEYYTEFQKLKEYR